MNKHSIERIGNITRIAIKISIFIQLNESINIVQKELMELVENHFVKYRTDWDKAAL
jgi:hypothetical protein